MKFCISIKKHVGEFFYELGVEKNDSTSRSKKTDAFSHI